jgi:hypothetical protein
MPLLASRPVTAIANLFLSRGIPVFMLHRMTHASQPENGKTTSRHLRRCLRYLVKNKYNFISLEREIYDSWLRMTNELARPLKIFCYPTGRAIDFGHREIETLKSNGFLGAVTTIPGVYKSEYATEKHIYRLPRFSLPQTMGEFIQYCSWIESTRSNYLESS